MGCLFDKSFKRQAKIMDNIVLIGMPGSGKSTVGVILAKTLGYDFIDTDLLISKSQSQTLQKIIDKQGLKRFLEIESDVIEKLSCDRTVIATGGSAVMSAKAMANLKAQGNIVYLDVPFDEIERRITNITTRGIAFDKGENLHTLFEKRTPLYRQYADITVTVSDRIGSTEAVVAKIIEFLKEYKAL